jgi:biopolymer transport protein ExbD
MTDITSNDNGTQHAKVTRSKRLNAKIDMTPMVDLGFLLITFFIFTSTMVQPGAMKLVMPKDKGEPMDIKQSGALTILPGAGGKIQYYEGFLDPAKVRKCSLGELRGIIAAKKEGTFIDDLFVVIKPSVKADYGNIIDILDEMTIADVNKYALGDITPQEESVVH